MNISKVQSNTSFKSGLTRQITELEKNTTPAKVKSYLKNLSYKDFTDFYTLEFKKNKAVALACKMCANIFIQFRKKHDYRHNCSMQDLVLPHGIYVFDENELKTPPQDGKHYYTTLQFYTHDILKDDKSFDHQTILFNNIFTSLEEINEINTIMLKNKIHSTGHFLHNFIHEWVHAIQGKLLYSISCQRGFWSYEPTLRAYRIQKVSKEENEIVADVLGEYAAKQNEHFPQFSEIFAEAWTKFICNSLNEECTGFKKDPIDELKKTPKEFREILKKVSTVTPANFLGDLDEDKTLISWDKKWDSKNFISLIKLYEPSGKAK